MDRSKAASQRMTPPLRPESSAALQCQTVAKRVGTGWRSADGPQCRLAFCVVIRPSAQRVEVTEATPRINGFGTRRNSESGRVDEMGSNPRPKCRCNTRGARPWRPLNKNPSNHHFTVDHRRW